MTISKALLGAAVALVIAMPATAQAQCYYRMNDVGRSHGYLSGPCNGAAQGYSGVYPKSCNLCQRGSSHADIPRPQRQSP